MSGKPLQLGGYFDEQLGLINLHNVTPPGIAYQQQQREKYIETTPAPYPRGERLGTNEAPRQQPEAYAKEDNSAELEDTYYERASNFMTGQANSILDYNNDGKFDSKDLTDMAKDVAAIPTKSATAVEEKITDMGASVVAKTGMYEEVQKKTDQAIVLLKTQTDSALVKVDEISANVDKKLGDLGTNLALALGGVVVAYIVFSRD